MTNMLSLSPLHTQFHKRKKLKFSLSKHCTCTFFLHTSFIFPSIMSPPYHSFLLCYMSGLSFSCGAPVYMQALSACTHVNVNINIITINYISNLEWGFTRLSQERSKSELNVVFADRRPQNLLQLDGAHGTAHLDIISF